LRDKHPEVVALFVKPKAAPGADSPKV